MSGPLRIAVVGAGRMGRVHLDACARAAGVRAVAVVDPVAGVRAELARAGLAVHGTVEELLAAGGFDAALVAAPSDLHLALVSQLADAGLAILCEKPIGVRADDAREAAAQVGRAGVVLQVGYWRRFVPALVELRRRILAGELGPVSLVSCYQWDERPPSGDFEARSGGIAIDMGVHEFDQLRWLTGQEVEAVAAAGGAETAAALATMSGGTIGFVSLGRRFPQPDSCWAEAIGPLGHVRTPFMWGAEGEAVFRAAIAAQLEAFAAALPAGRPGGAGGEDAIAALEAAERAAAVLTRARTP